MTFRELSVFFEKIEATRSRLEMTDLLAKIFTQISKDEASIVSYMIGGRVSPMFIPAEFDVAEKMLLRVLTGVGIAGKKRMDIKKRFDKLGDLGLVADKLITSMNKRGKGLSISEVYERLWEIALVSGHGSVRVRTQRMHDLIMSSSPVESKYIVRILMQKLRLGCSSKTVLDAVSMAVKGNKDDRDEIERACGVCSDLGYVVSTYLESGLDGVRKIDIVPGVPVFSMLVEREKNAEAIMKRIPEPIVQPKFDGLRCQIHIGTENKECFADRVWWKYWGDQEDMQKGLFSDQIEDKRVRLFSRNLEDMTEMFPEVVEAVGQLDIKSAVFDSEVIGYNEATDEFVPFQETMIRKRKYGITNAARRMPVKAFVFDVLYLNGRTLMHETNEKRMEVVTGSISKKGVVVRSSSGKVKSAKKLQKLFMSYVTEGLEGVIVKDPHSHYKPGKRGFDWIKMKRSFQGHLADTVDVVILGYYFGRGRRSSFGMGALLGGVYDEDRDEFVSLAKIGTGITDAQWKNIKKDIDGILVEKMPGRINVEKILYPDKWVYPKIVATVEADEITKSPNHTAGRTDSSPGFALRFPRLKVWKRDKLPEDVTSVKEIRKMFDNQG